MAAGMCNTREIAGKITLLGDADQDKKLTAVRALALLLEHNHNSQETILSAATAIRSSGGIPQLVALLKNPVPKLTTEATYILGCLCYDDLDPHFESQEAIRAAGGIPLLVKLLNCPTDDVKYFALSTLGGLANSNPNNQKAIRISGGILPIVYLSSHRNDDMKKHANSALWFLSDDPQNASEIEKAKAEAARHARGANAKAEEQAAAAKKLAEERARAAAAKREAEEKAATATIDVEHRELSEVTSFCTGHRAWYSGPVNSKSQADGYGTFNDDWHGDTFGLFRNGSANGVFIREASEHALPQLILYSSGSEVRTHTIFYYDSALLSSIRHGIRGLPRDYSAQESYFNSQVAQLSQAQSSAEAYTSEPEPYVHTKKDWDKEIDEAERKLQKVSTSWFSTASEIKDAEEDVELCKKARDRAPYPPSNGASCTIM